LLLSASFTLTEITRHRQQKIIFYSTGKQSSIGFIKGEQLTLLADSVLLNDKKANKFQLDGSKTLFGANSQNKFALDTITDSYQKLPTYCNPLRSLGNNFLFQNTRIVLIDSIPKSVGECIRLKVNYLVIRHNPKLRIKDLQQLYQPGMIIFDGSNSSYKTDKWMAECKKAGLKAYSIKDNGAFIVDL
jgi:competence protein ComEC